MKQLGLHKDASLGCWNGIVQKGGDGGRIQESDDFRCTCMLYRLKYVEIRQFGGGDFELKLIKFLLKNAKVLKTMVVISLPGMIDLKKWPEIGGKLLTYPRASTNSLILFL
ncbi:hypothetical protein ACLOJK_020452 [Asimina triloba]